MCLADSLTRRTNMEMRIQREMSGNLGGEGEALRWLVA